MQQIYTERIKDKTQLDGQGDPLGIMQEIEIWPNKKWYIHNPESVQENETHKHFWDFKIQTDHLI